MSFSFFVSIPDLGMHMDHKRYVWLLFFTAIEICEAHDFSSHYVRFCNFDSVFVSFVLVGIFYFGDFCLLIYYFLSVQQCDIAYTLLV